jgi:tetratricopeptide (TPR) repeat protein
MYPTNDQTIDEMTLAAQRKQTLGLLLVILFGMCAIASINLWRERQRASHLSIEADNDDEPLYVSGTAMRRMSLAFNGLVADWYWMRALQYVGRKALAHPSQVQLDDLSALKLDQLYPLLDATTTLDPQFIAAYEYGAIVLPAISEPDAIKLLQKGIAANPHSWWLYHHLGYIYWQRGDYRQASEIYGAGAQLPNAAPWMRAMSAQMSTEGGSRATARAMYMRLYEEANDAAIKAMAVRRLLQLASLDERDQIRSILHNFAERNRRCVSSWGEIVLALRAAHLRLDASGAPIDPTNTPYVLVTDACDVDLDKRSEVPYK